MVRSLGSLCVYLTGNKTGLDKVLKEGSKGVKDFQKYAMQAAGAIGLAFSFSAALAGVNKLVDSMDKIGKASANFGVSSGFFQELEYAAQRTNTPIEQVQAGFAKIKKMAGDLAAGDKKAVDVFAALGLNPEAVRKMAPEELFNKVNSALAGLDDQMRSSIGAKLYGEQFEKMNNFLKDYVSLGQEARDRGLIIKDEEIKNAEALKDAMLNLERAMTSLTANSGFLQWLTKVAEGLDAWLNKTKLKEKAGLMTRSEALEYVINKAEKSGEYTPEQINAMRNAKTYYENDKVYNTTKEGGRNAWIREQYGEAFGSFDELLKKNGYKSLARNEQGEFTTASGVEVTKGLTEEQERAVKQIKELAQKAGEIRRQVQKEIDPLITQKNGTTSIGLRHSLLSGASQKAVKANNEIQDLIDQANEIRRSTGISGTDPLLDQSKQAVANQIKKFSPELKELESKLAKAAAESETAMKKVQESEKKRIALVNEEKTDIANQLKYKSMEAAGDFLKADMERYIDGYKKKIAATGRKLTPEEEKTARAGYKRLQDMDSRFVPDLKIADTMQQGSLEAYRLQAKQSDPAQKLRQEQRDLLKKTAEANERTAAAVEKTVQNPLLIADASLGGIQA